MYSGVESDSQWPMPLVADKVLFMAYRRKVSPPLGLAMLSIHSLPMLEKASSLKTAEADDVWLFHFR